MYKAILLFAAVILVAGGEARAQFAGGAGAGGAAGGGGFGNAATMGAGTMGMGGGAPNVGFGKAGMTGAGGAQYGRGMGGNGNAANMAGGFGARNGNMGLGPYPGSGYGYPYPTPNYNIAFRPNTSLGIANSPQQVGVQGPNGVQYYYKGSSGTYAPGYSTRQAAPGYSGMQATPGYQRSAGYGWNRYGSPSQSYYGNPNYAGGSMFSGRRTMMTGSYGRGNPYY